MIMRNYYCYIYHDEQWRPYYVGKGQGRRQFRLRGVKTPKKEYIQTFYFDSEWEAFECEIELIAFWGRKCDGGMLLNMTTGGAGAPGLIDSEETRMKKSQSHIGMKHPPIVEARRIEKIRKAINKPVTLINPQGVSITFASRATACRTLGWSSSSLYRLLKREFKQLKGWRISNA